MNNEIDDWEIFLKLSSLIFFYFNSWLHKVQDRHSLYCWITIKTIFLHFYFCSLERSSQKSHGTNLFCTWKLLHLQADNTTWLSVTLTHWLSFILLEQNTNNYGLSDDVRKVTDGLFPLLSLACTCLSATFVCKFWVTSSQLLISYLYGIMNTLLNSYSPNFTVKKTLIQWWILNNWKKKKKVHYISSSKNDLTM